MRRLVLAASVAGLVAGVPATVLANGRPPLTNGVFLRPGDDHSIYVRSTFGLLISHDDGCTFRWVCEKAIGYGGEFDPKYAIATDGTIFATTFTGLRVSRDNGCSWVTATAEAPVTDPGRIADIWIDAIDISPNGDVWVATAESAKENDVFKSVDNGRTFTPAGLRSPIIWWKSIRVAKSDPQRIYVTGYQVAGTAQAHVRRSTNAGQTWTPVPIPSNVQYGATPVVYVTAVDPANPDHLYMTSVGANPPDGDRVYRSLDGADTWTEVAATTAAVRDIVIRSNGSALIATLSGGSYESQAMTGPFAKLGAVRPNAQDINPPRFGCLAQKADGTLIGCGANWQPDYMAVGRAQNPLAFQKLFRFVDLAGPVACPAGTAEADECAPMWPALQKQFGSTGPGVCGANPDLPMIDLPTPPPPTGTGCCDAGASGPTSFAVGALAGVLLLRRRRR